MSQEILNGIATVIDTLGYKGIAEDVRNNHEVPHSVELFLRMARLAGYLTVGDPIESRMRLLVGRLDGEDRA